ncbi:adenine methyltransferase [Pseudomonas phage 8P]|nr:adenine methyltransferase [Pseudomonas phage 8P]
MAIGGHHSPVALKDEWLTPPDILDALGSFDLDPCSPINRPWPTAAAHYTILDDGLKQPWHGRVWCNPPYGLEAAKWLDRLADHGDGIALIFARTETAMFFEHVWAKASALLFIRGRLHFHHVNGQRAKANGGAPSVLVAYGERNAAALRNCGIDGHLVMLDAAQLTMQ